MACCSEKNHFKISFLIYRDLNSPHSLLPYIAGFHVLNYEVIVELLRFQDVKSTLSPTLQSPKSILHFCHYQPGMLTLLQTQGISSRTGMSFHLSSASPKWAHLRGNGKEGKRRGEKTVRPKTRFQGMWKEKASSHPLGLLFQKGNSPFTSVMGQ